MFNVWVLFFIAFHRTCWGTVEAAVVSSLLPGDIELEEAMHVSLCVYHIIYDTMMKLKSRPIWLK